MIEQTLEWFGAFVDEHRMADPVDNARLELKREHCLLVMTEARDLAREQRLSPHMVALATIAGLCHDVGRFPQYRRYQTFRDADSANHAILGTMALARNGGLRWLDDRDRQLVREAIVVHNRRAIPKTLAAGGDPTALQLARIVRDADKIDIVRVMLSHLQSATEKDDVVCLGLPDIPDRVNAAMIDAIDAGRIGSYAAMESINDFALLLLSWINDMAFARTRGLFFERGYVRELFAVLPDQAPIAAFKTRYFDRFAPCADRP
jgi:hypothetical protein